MSNIMDGDRGLIILSFDAGGIRGLSSLLILRECMARLQGQLGLDKPPEVHECFDMIGGTGTGGISAAMLGRLRMPLDNAIEQFAKLASEVFSDKKYLRASGTGSFKSTKMQQVLKSIVLQATGNENERMMDRESSTAKCKTVVFAMSEQNLNAGRPCAFRSYGGAPNQMPDCAIWEALCATTAHPDLFKSIEIGDELKWSFVDGGLGCSNPLAHILSEVKLAYPTRHISCVVSIGAGHVKTIQIPKFRLFQRLLPTNAIEAMKAIATDAEQEAQRMALRFGSAPNVYFRLNVDQGLQSLDLSDWERFREVTAHARGYMHLVRISKKISNLATSMRERRRIIAAIQIDGQILVQPEPVNLPQAIASMPASRQPTSLFVEREQPVRKIVDYLLSVSPKKKIFVLHGLGGSGKTQMALHIVERTRGHWSDIIFVDATSTKTIKTTFMEFAIFKGIGDTHEDALKWLVTNPTSWLLVVDNADDPRIDHRSYIPECSHGSVLITTRNRVLLELVPEKDSSYSVAGMEPEEALQLLLKASRWEHSDLTPEDLESAERLLEEFGRLPLAIVQAGRYIHRTECAFPQYYTLYLKNPMEMLGPDPFAAVLADSSFIPAHRESPLHSLQRTEYSTTVFGIFSREYQLLDTPAQHLLCVMAFMQHDQITLGNFHKATERAKFGWLSPTTILSDPEKEVYNAVQGLLISFLEPASNAWNINAFLSVIKELLSRSLIDYDRMKRLYVLHPLFQTWVRAVVQDIELAYVHLVSRISGLEYVSPVAGILEHLSRRGCAEVTGRLDPSRFSDYPVSTGGFGDVYRGAFYDGSLIALKCLRLYEDQADPEAASILLKQIARELYIWSKCDHPNVLGLIGVAQFRDQIAMVSQWMEYGNLRRLLSRHPEVDRYAMCAQIIDGVVYLHEKGIVHGDLKGDNVLFTGDFTAKLTDFGSSRLKTYSMQFSQTSSRQAMSVHWVAPEIFKGETGLTAEADVWSLGMEVITGEIPYARLHECAVITKIMSYEHPARPEADIPSNIKHADLLWSLLTVCWTPGPKDRPSSVAAKSKMEHILAAREIGN